MLLGVVQVLTVEVHDVFQHVAGLHGRTAGIQSLGLQIAVDSLVEEALPAMLIALPG